MGGANRIGLLSFRGEEDVGWPLGVWRTLEERAKPMGGGWCCVYAAQAAVSSEHPEDQLATAKVERGASNRYRR
jgi:hypothetical protein